MTIRLAVDDSKTEAKTDTSFLKVQVLTRSGPDASQLETEESIGDRLSSPEFVCMIDDAYDTVAGFDVRPAAQEVEVIWWLPRARWAEDNMALLVPVFGAACKEVMTRLDPADLSPEPALLWPGSANWDIYGWYPGVGEDIEKRTETSREMVQFWLDYFNSTPASLIATLGRNPQNESQYGPVSTVDAQVEFAAWVAAQ